MENLNEEFQNLSELLRTAYKLISPITYHDDLKRLSPEFVKSDAEKNPGCYLKLGQGSEHTLFPICNRYGYKDAKMIEFSLKLAKRMAEKQPDGHLPGVVIKLTKLLNKYNKAIPNTVSQAALKTKSTKTFNKKMKPPTLVKEGYAVGASAVLLALYFTYKGLKKKYSSEKDPEQKEILKQKMIKQKQKIEKAKAKK
jgi:hypothetical protein